MLGKMEVGWYLAIAHTDHQGGSGGMCHDNMTFAEERLQPLKQPECEDAPEVAFLR